MGKTKLKHTFPKMERYNIKLKRYTAKEGEMKLKSN